MSKRNTIESILARFVIDPETGCWLWPGAKNKNGYGQVKFDGKLHKTHRLIYEHFKGLIPEGLEPDHKCRNRACGNPDHLEPVTHQMNVRRGVSPHAKNAAKTHCIRGHLFDEDNTVVSDGVRQCHTCNLTRQRNNYWGNWGHIRQYQRKWCAANRAVINQRQRERYYLAHRGRIPSVRARTICGGEAT